VDRCEECTFIYNDVPVAEIAPEIRALGPRYRTRLEGDPEVLRTRSSPEVWSALEYACHVRDVLGVQRERMQLALVEDCPAFTPMGRDERVVRDHYNEQEPLEVAAQLIAAAEAFAAECDGLSAEQWERLGLYNWPTQAERTMAWLGRHTVHEGVHHLRDIDAVLVAVSS
jgi:DinB superfamily